MTIFSRILIACILPLIIIFSAVIVSINNVVHRQIATYAGEIAKMFANEVSKQISDDIENVSALTKVIEAYLSEIDVSDPNAEKEISEWIKSILRATPYIYNIWMSFEPGEFWPDERFTRDFVNVGDSIVTIHDLDADVMHDPEQAPWYYYPFTLGEMWFESADWYDYRLGFGSKYTGTVGKPIRRGGKIVGVVGVDMYYENIFRFLHEREIDGERKILMLAQTGEVVFSTDSTLINTSLFDKPFPQKEYMEEALSQGGPFVINGVSPFFNSPSRMFFHPIVSKDSKSKQLFLYVDLPTAKLFDSADFIARWIAFISVCGLLLFFIVLFFTVRNILWPVKKLTDGANMIAAGNIDVSFDAMLDAELKGKNVRAKDEFYTLFSALKKMRESLSLTEKYKAVSQAKSEFLAKMSHEIRTPMNAITGMAELALRENMTPAAKEHIITIKQAGANLLSIINDILDVSKIESGKLEIVSVDYNFGSLVNDVVSIIRMRVINSKVRFTVNVDRKIPSVLFGDEVRVRQVLLNILSNAVKYTREGYISLSIRGELIDLKTVLLTISVADTGIGIKSEDIPKLFGSFVQVDVEANRGIEGTGLGLAITKNLVSAMGGEITVQSVYGKGSTFTVTLRQRIRSHEPLAAVVKPEYKSVIIYERRELCARSLILTLNNLGVRNVCVGGDRELLRELESGKYTFIFIEQALYETVRDIVAVYSAKTQVVLLTNFGNAVAEKGLSVIAMPAYSISVANVLNGVSDDFSYSTDSVASVTFCAPDAKVLVVDDIKTNLEVAKGLLAPYGMKVDTCLSGEEALHAVESNNYDLILMDHMMPVMDGIEAVKRIRARGGGHFDTRIVALTANAVSGTKEMFLKSGFDDFLSKPIDTQKFGSMLEKWIPAHKQLEAVKSDGAAGDDGDGISIDGVNVKLGISRTGGTVAGYLRTLSIFSGDGREKIEEIKKALDTGDLKRYITCVHALKSAAANVGAIDLSESAKALEAAAGCGDRAFINANTHFALEDLEALLRGVDTVIAAKRNAADPEKEIDVEALKAVLTKLSAAIDGIDVAAVNAGVKELERFENAAAIGGEISGVGQSVLNGEYDDALSRIEALLRKI